MSSHIQHTQDRAEELCRLLEAERTFARIHDAGFMDLSDPQTPKQLCDLINILAVIGHGPSAIELREQLGEVIQKSGLGAEAIISAVCTLLTKCLSDYPASKKGVIQQ